MLAPTVDGRFCAWLRSRRARKGAALLTRLALRGLQGVSGRGASRHIDAKASNKGLGFQEESSLRLASARVCWRATNSAKSA